LLVTLLEFMPDFFRKNLKETVPVQAVVDNAVQAVIPGDPEKPVPIYTINLPGTDFGSGVY